MKVRAAYFTIVVTLLFMLSGCGAEEIPIKENESTPKGSSPACVKPFIQSGVGCCLDANNNGACDAGEVANEKVIVEKAPRLFNSTVPCRRSLIDGFISCAPLWLPPVSFDNPSAIKMRLVAGFSGWDAGLITIPQLETEAGKIQSLDGQTVFGYERNVSPAASWPIALSVNIAKWPQDLVTATDEVLVRVCTRALGSNEINCQNISYSLSIGVQ